MKEREGSQEQAFFIKNVIVDLFGGIKWFLKECQQQVRTKFFLIHKVESSTVSTEAIPGPSSWKAVAFAIV